MPDFSIFTGVDGPSVDAGEPATELNLGHYFRVTQVCWVKAIRFWRAATTINGTQKGRIFATATGTVLPGTAVDFPPLSGTGWQVATLPAPVQIAADVNYKVAVHFTDNYSATLDYWSTGAGVGGRTNGPLVAPDAGGAPLALGSIPQGAYGYTTDPDVMPATYFRGGNYWIDLILTDTEPASHIGTGTAPLTLDASGAGTKTSATTATAALTLAASGTGAKRTAGTGTAPLTLDASGPGAKRAGSSTAAPLTLAAEGTGVHSGINAATAPLTAGATGAGVHHGTGTGTAPLTLDAHGSASPSLPAGPIDPKTSLKFGGDTAALGGPGGTPPPMQWPTEAHILMYPAGTFLRARTKLINIEGGLVDSALLKRNERLLLFVEEASVVCKRCYDSLYITLPICPSGQTGAGSISQPTCEDM